MSTPITVEVFPYRSDAEIAVARLSADGIKAAIRVDDEGGLNPGFFGRYGVRVEVEESALEDAYESLGIERVRLPSEMVDAMIAHGAWAHPLEACGLLAFGPDNNPAMVFCLTNADESERRFTIDPVEHFGCVQYAQARGWTIGGVFHSHAVSDPEPSRSDIEGGGDPDWLNVIVGPMSAQMPQVRAFRFDDDSVVEVSLTVQP